MKTRFVSALLALALPLCAQEASAETEALFYKAFYMEKGARDFAGAMSLYEKFLVAAPAHKLAKEAAKQQFALLDRTGKTKDRDMFREKYASLLGDAAVATGRPAGEAGDAGDAPAGRAGRGDGAAGGAGGRPQRGEGAGGAAGAGGRMDPAARMAELEKQLAEATAAGKEEDVKRITEQIANAKQRAERGAQGGGTGRARGGLFGTKKLAEMTPEELTTFKDGIARMETMMERMRENMTEEQAKALDTNMAALKKGLGEGGKLEDAQAAVDKIRESMPRRGGGGGGGGGR